MAKNTEGTTALQRIEKARRKLLAEYVSYMRTLDESDPAVWQKIVRTVREAGLDRDVLCRELSCAWSTILRWDAGQTIPGPFARAGIKAKLIDLLEAQQAEHQSIAAE